MSRSAQGCSHHWFRGLRLLRKCLVQEAGALHLGDIAQRTRLGVDLLAPALAARLGALIPGKLEGGLLYTDAHVARIRVRLRLIYEASRPQRGATSPLERGLLCADAQTTHVRATFTAKHGMHIAATVACGSPQTWLIRLLDAPPDAQPVDATASGGSRSVLLIPATSQFRSQ